MKKADQELDLMLSEMAEEVPPVPADFHERWTAAIRSEEKDVPATEEKRHKTPESLVRWTRVLSVAAVFVFLIGGTLLYRNSRNSLSAIPVQEEADLSMADGGPDDSIALFGVNAANIAAKGADSVNMYEAASEEAEESAAEPAAESVYMTVQINDPEAAGTMPLMTAMPTQSAPVPAEMPTEEPDEDQTEKSAEEEADKAGETGDTGETSGFLQNAGVFFTDMGGFLLTALPYLAVLAVPAVVALVYRRRKKTK